ncbi:MAG: Maf family nucleotide pyrophosphatase [Pseudomonadota bacterium]|nr:Maf family nucleotide pyrophosphatase [Pseudomonadota bacterium]
MYPELKTRLVLASGSPSRARLLAAAGFKFDVHPSDLDERAARDAMRRDGALQADDVAEVLARAKAEQVSALHPEALTIGSDQVLALGDRLFEKPATMEAARQTLLDLSGKTHKLHCAVALARNGATLWSEVHQASLTMRRLNLQEIGRYLAGAGEGVLTSVGAYQLEGLGANLFETVEGDYFTILGLPLLSLLGALHEQGALA